ADCRRFRLGQVVSRPVRNRITGRRCPPPGGGEQSSCCCDLQPRQEIGGGWEDSRPAGELGNKSQVISADSGRMRGEVAAFYWSILWPRAVSPNAGARLAAS